jgi:glucose-6-phosphate isomerase
MDSKALQARIILTTDQNKGALRRLAQRHGFRSFVIPDDVGGRFSVLTPVGLFPIAVAGIDLKEILAGARDAAEICQQADFKENPALRYAAIRQLLYRKGKVIEILANFDPRLHYFGEWWKQLFGESEGKDGTGIFPAAVDFTTDLHALGQLIQAGTRNIFETFLITREEQIRVNIPTLSDDFDGFNYLAGQTLAYVNHRAYLGTALAHRDGDCPNLAISVPQLSAYWLGQLFYFFEHAVAISGYLQGVNPFDQPGVEAYKNNMFKLLGKPGTK